MNKLYYLCLFLLSYSAQAQQVFIHCGQLIDGNSDYTRQELALIIEENRIVAIKEGFQQPGQNDQLIDLRRQTVMPGLMDMQCSYPKPEQQRQLF